jgi:Ni,Fe-hydrogenase III large subunit
MSASASPRTVATGVEQVLNLLRAATVRLVTIFGDVDPDGSRRVHYVVDVDLHEYRHFSVPVNGPIPSATLITPSAAWHERELHEQYGVEIDGHPDLRPLMIHENGTDANAPAAPYPFLKVQGEGVCEVPVGPVHAGIIEPGHFRFSVVGDTVLHLELRHFYTHKGTEKLFEGTPVGCGGIIAESVSGDNCFTHAVAYCQAIENAFGIAVPPRADALRLLGLELERMMAHIADVGALCGDVGFTVPAAYTARLKEALLQASVQFIGTRFWRGVSVPGGMGRDVTAEGVRDLKRAVLEVARDFAELASIIRATPSLQNRCESTGILKKDIARALGVVGPVARASGLDVDVRRDHPYGAYRDLAIDRVHYEYGDVLARARVRIDETAISARLITDTLDTMAGGAVCTSADWSGSAEGYSAVESPRGELFYWVRVVNGQISRCHIKSPSFQNWPALPLAMPGNIIADFPLINKSFNLSYSGCDR